MDISPENLEGFSYIAVDIEHRRDAPFTRSLLRVYMDSLNSIIPDPDVINDDGFALRNNMRDPVLLENQTNRQRNRPLIAVIVLAMLSYARSERNNLVQRVNTQFAFANNIPKQFVELFHQLG